MDWFKEAKLKFYIKKPEHFVDFNHCSECREHEKTLHNYNVDTIGIDQLGNPGWDPICYCTSEGKKYYIPALIRLSIDTIENEFYFGQLLFHLNDNELIHACNEVQKNYISDFISLMFNEYSDILEKECALDKAIAVSEKWSEGDSGPRGE